MRNHRKHAELMGNVTGPVQRWFKKFLLTSLCVAAIACPAGAWGANLYGAKSQDEAASPILNNNLVLKYENDEFKTEGNWHTGITTSGVTSVGKVYGMYHSYSSGNAEATMKNGDTQYSLTIEGGEFSGYVFGGYASSYSANATAFDNELTISGDGTFSGSVYGGYAFSYSANATAFDNELTISGDGTFSGSVYGGYAEVDGGNGTAEASNNTLTISGGTFSDDVNGGYAAAYAENATATASDNKFTISGGKFSSYVYGGQASAKSCTASSNTLTIEGGTFSGYVLGGSASGEKATASSNILTIKDGTFSNDVLGGEAYASDDATASSNILNISGDRTFSSVYGGSAEVIGENGAAKASGNTLKISGNGTFDGYVYGGLAKSEGENGTVTASENKFTISGGTFNGYVYGGSAMGYENGTATASDNELTISGGTFGTENEPSNIFGGYAQTNDGTKTEASRNTVTIEGSPNLTYATLHGGATFNLYTYDANGTSSGNTLKIYTTGLTAQNVKYFQNYIFVLPSTAKNNDVVLTLTGGTNKEKTDISGSNVSVAVKSGSVLQNGDQIILLKNENGLTSTGFTQTEIEGEQGIALTYKFKVTANDTALIAKLGSDDPTDPTDPTDPSDPTPSVRVNEKSKAPTEAQTVAPALLNQAADLIASEGMQNLQAMPTNGTMGTFGVASAGNLRHKTGSHTNVKGVSTMLGVGKRFDPSYGTIATGAFFEYGYGDYSSHNEFSTGYVRGDGHSRYYGGGIMARYDIPCGVYAEGSLRLGGSDTYWSSKQLSASYDSSALYFGAHFGIGWLWKFTENFKLDVYGKYFYAYQEGDDITILGDTFKYDAVHSNRIRLGARLGYDFTEQIAAYVGAGWEREFSGSAHGTVYGFDIDAPSTRGNSGIFEGGFTFKPKKDLALSTDLGITGYVGQKKGVTGFLKLNYSF